MLAAVEATARPEAQTRDDRPVALVGIVGAGSFADDEGSLGGRVVLVKPPDAPVPTSTTGPAPSA